jgi:AAA ATPase domain
LGAVTENLIGRRRELAELIAGVDAVAGGSGQLFLLEGEAGIGKTHLANALADEARARRFDIAWGRCWEEGGAPPYWPWTQVLRAVVRQRGAERLLAGNVSALRRLVSIVPELRPIVARDADDAGDESAADQFALFDAVTTLLKQSAAEQPLLVVVDDLHAADHDSLRLLQFLAHELPRSGIFVLGAYRADDASFSGADPLLTKLARDGRVLPVRGLTERHVAALVERIAGKPAGTDVVRDVHRATGGNPLHVDSITYLLVAEDRLHGGDSRRDDVLGATELPLPQSIVAATRSRLGYLDEATRALLQVASVIGRTFTLPVLGAVTGHKPDALLDALDVATTRGTLRASGTVRGGFVFEHILVRDALYRELEPSRRAELHWRVGTALEQIHAADLDQHVAELAHHFLFASAPGRDAGPAIEYSARAGERALAQTAYEEAAVHFRRALDTLAASADGDPARRCELLIALGAARTRSGDTGGGRAIFLEAAALARHLGRGDRLAEAAIGYAGVTGYHFSGRRDETLIALIEEAVSALPAGDSKMRVRLLARLAVALYWSDLDARRLELSEEAVAMARRLGEPSTLALAIHSRRYAQWGPDNFEQRLADAARSRELAVAANDLELAVSASRWRFTDLLEDGDIAAADQELDAHAELAERLRQPFVLAHTAQFRALRAIMQGRFDDGEALAAEARRYSERAGNPLAGTVYGSQLLPMWWQRGDHEHLATFLETALRTAPPHGATTSATALLHAELGERETAAAMIEQLAAPGFHKFRRDMLFLPGLAHLTRACAVLDEGSHADALYDVLRPYTGRVVVVGAPAQSCWGPVDHYLGVLASLAGRDEWAIEHFDAALLIAARLGAPALLAETRFELAVVLLRSAGEAHERAGALLRAARRTAEALALRRLVGRLDDVPAVAPALGPSGREMPVSTLAGTTVPPCTLRHDGDFWTVTTPRGSVHVRDAKGMRHLAVLMSQPGQGVHVLDLATGGVGSEAPTTAVDVDDGYGAGFGDAGEVLDEAAKQAYRRRLAELDELIAEAEGFNDIGRAAQLSAERGMFLEQLAQAVGLGGRDRRAVSISERARVNVTRAIRSATRRIGELDPEAGRYLDATVVTGAYCVFEPQRGVVPSQ